MKKTTIACRLHRTSAAKAALLTTTLVFASASAQGTAPQLVDFSASVAQSGARALGQPSDAQTATLRALREDPRVTSLHVGRGAARTVIATRRFELRLPDRGRALRVHDLEHARIAERDHLYRFDPANGDETSLVVEDGNVLGWIRAGGETWTLIPLGGGETAVVRYDTGAIGHDHPPPPRGPETGGDPSGEIGSPDALNVRRRAADAAGDDATTIDVLAVYTPRARARAGSAAGSIEMLLAQGIVTTNRIFANSGLDTRLRLVHTGEIDYTESEQGMQVDICYLATRANQRSARCGEPPHTPDALDEVLDMRDEHGADLVVLVIAWTSSGGPGGLGQLAGAFSVVSVTAQQSGTQPMSHEVGHNLWGAHNPGRANVSLKPYGHGRCNPEEKWRTLMAYPDSGPPERRPCWRRLPLLAGPRVIGPNGTPTGDRDTHDMVRLFRETTPIAAAYRERRPRTATTHLVPYVPRTGSANGLHAFVRVINRSAVGGTVAIRVTDDDGAWEETSLEVEGGTTTHFDNRDLEAGGVKGLGAGLGPSERHRRLSLKSDLDLKVLAYARTADGFVTSLHQTAPKWRAGDTTGAVVEFFNPGSNRRIASVLRIINLEPRNVEVVVHGYDDRMTTGRWVARLRPKGRWTSFVLGADEARNLPSWELEAGPADGEGGLGDGRGKWTLAVSADGDVEVMSLLYNSAGYVTNVSR